jgi:hypothetical protein
VQHLRFHFGVFLMAKTCVIIAGHEGDILYRHTLCLVEPDHSEENMFTEAVKAALDHGLIQEDRLTDYILLLN